jgi:hypothetical protein
MLMMGYTKDDIDKFQGTLMNVYAMGVCNKKQAEVLKEIKDFFDGLLKEGRI